jgi:hypothetical protein
MKELEAVRGKACKKVILACVANDAWNMERYAQINAFLFECLVKHKP